MFDWEFVLRRLIRTLYLCAVLFSGLAATCQTFTKLADFDGANGYNPSGQLMQAWDTNLYGVTAKGGTAGGGTLYEVMSDGTLSTFADFNSASVGASPSGRLLQLWGLLWGTTTGGDIGPGSVFLAQPPLGFTGWNSFCSVCGDQNASRPHAGLITASDFKVYGTTSAGGSDACPGGCGVILQMQGLYWLNYAHTFNGSDGANPRGELMQASDSNLYGTTVNGGNSNCQDGCGTIYRISLDGDFTSLYRFCSQNNCADGSNPYGALVQDLDGNLYGTTYAGGNVGLNCPIAGCGTIFKITPYGTLTTLYSFCEDFFCPTGANPQSGLVLATDGNLYGAANGGGDGTLGTLFRITPSGKLTLLHTFTGEDGAYPGSALFQANDGKFYGTTTQGGMGYGGTLFRLDIDFNATLSVNKSGNGNISSDDGKIQCGYVCSANYESGDALKLTVTPDPGWGLATLSGCDLVEDNVCSVTISHAREVVVTFAPLYQLSVTTSGSGSVVSNDSLINCGQTCSHLYLAGTYVVLTATPVSGWGFTGWAGCDQSNGNSCSVRMDTARNVSATFKFLYPLTVASPGHGLISSGDGHIYCGSSCSSTYPDGSQVKLTGNPNPGFMLSSWSGCDSINGNVCKVGVAGARNVSATFTPAQVSVTSLSAQPSSVRGGDISIATVSLSQPAPAGGVGIAVNSDQPAVVHPPLIIVVPGGSSSLSFALRTSVVRTKVVAKLTAALGTSHADATLTLTPGYSQAEMAPLVSAGTSQAEATSGIEERQSRPTGADPNLSQHKASSTVPASVQARKTGTASKAKKAKPKTAAKVGVHYGRSPVSSRGFTASKPEVLPPAPANPSDERKQYSMRIMTEVAPVGEYNGDVRDLPQVASHERPERELIGPVDRVHSVFPPAVPKQSPMAPTSPMPQPVISFPGLSFSNFCGGGQCGVGHPPDTTGAVGLRYYIQAINMSYGVFDKGTGSWLGSFTEDSLWAGQPQSVCSGHAWGDPVVLYDQTADRWILANLAFVNGAHGPYYECIAASKSGDPISGGWWFYELRMDQDPVPANTFNDYPKLGIWNDGCLYLGADGYAGDNYSGQVVLSMSRDDMYSGNNLRYSLSYLDGSANFGLFPATMLGNGDNLPSPTSSEYFVQQSQTNDAFNVRTLPAGSCINGGAMSAAVAVPHDTYNTVPDALVPQPPPADSSHLLDTIEDTLMQWVQYRKIGSSESLWVSHTTYVTGSNSSPQWAQIDVTGGNINPTVVQQQIYRPDSSLFRWMSSLAVNGYGDVALCYSTSNATAPNFPSIQCSGRMANDPLGQLTLGETEYVTGNGSQVFDCGDGPCHRWGDYSSTTVDPYDDCTFWHTNMFYPDPYSGNWGNYSTQIVAFRYGNCNPPPSMLTVNKSGSGTVTSDDWYINCGETCSHQYDPGTRVGLTATPAPGWTFDSWTGCDNPAGNFCYVRVYGKAFLTANFKQGIYTLTVNKYGSGTGTVTSDDGYINCGGTCWYDYPGGTVVHLTANPAPGSRFDGWTGCDSVQNHVCTVTMAWWKYVSATFDVQTEHFRMSVSKYGTGTGTVTSSDAYINCGASCSYDYDPGTEVLLTAQPTRPGSVLTGWVGCDQVQDNTCQVKMLAVRNVTAKFNYVTATLTAIPNGRGMLSSGDGHIYCGQSCSYAYPQGAQIRLTAVPDAGSTVSAWSGCDTFNANVCTVTVMNAASVTATFTQPNIKIASVVLSPVSLKGGNISVATVTLAQPAPAGGMSVALSSDHPLLVFPPSLVSIPPGSTSFSFAVRTSPVRAKTVATVTASANASQQSATLTLTTNYGSSQDNSSQGSAQGEGSQSGVNAGSKAASANVGAAKLGGTKTASTKAGEPKASVANGGAAKAVGTRAANSRQSKPSAKAATRQDTKGPRELPVQHISQR